MGRVKEISRKARGRKRNKVVYIVCEGKETEPKYFKSFRTRECNISVIPIESQYKAADALVKKAKASLGHKNPYYPEDGDTLWCVFDRDDNSNVMLRTARELAAKEGYRVIYSNPSFELWFLLHFINQRSEVADCDALIRLLDQPGRLEKYEKNINYFEELEPLRAKAKERAVKLVEQHKKDRTEIISRESNPVTTVYELIDYIIENR